METSSGSVKDEVRGLIDAYRNECLWFLREDYYPQTPTEMIRVLDQIQRHGNLDAFRRAATLKQWLSRNSDLFHDTQAALQATWAADRALLAANGYEIKAERERAGFIEAHVGIGRKTVLMQWAQDSAFRFFPLVQHDELGLTLHPFDLATNKVLALIGRLEARDWIAVINCHERIQPLGYLAWAACGKDPGFSPASILEQAGRSARYSDEEVRGLSFEGEAPTAAELSKKWHTSLTEARAIVSLLPAEHAGQCVLSSEGSLCCCVPSALPEALAAGAVRFHAGSIKGTLPSIVQ